MNQYQDTKIIDCTAPSGGVTVGVPVIIGGCLVVVPSASASAGAKFAGQLDGIFPIKKATGFSLAVGDIVYFDFTTDKRVESSSALIPIGRCIEAAGSSATRVIVLLAPELSMAALATQVLDFNLRPANGVAATVVYDFIAPCAGEAVSLDERTNARPSSSSGTVKETVTNLTGTVNLLAATDIDLEADITNGTTLSVGLSATPANLKWAAGDIIRFAIATNNSDAVAGGGIQHQFKWRRTY